jgi:hypothetical protein
MRLHIDALGTLHLVWGAFGVMTGLSLSILAAGTRAALAGGVFGLGERAAVAVLAGVGALLLLGGAASALTGRAIRRRQGRARMAALMLAVPNLVLVPFGTALGVYTFWVLLNDDARRVFGRPPHAVGLPK